MIGLVYGVRNDCDINWCHKKRTRCRPYNYIAIQISFKRAMYKIRHKTRIINLYIANHSNVSIENLINMQIHRNRVCFSFFPEKGQQQQYQFKSTKTSKNPKTDMDSYIDVFKGKFLNCGFSYVQQSILIRNQLPSNRKSIYDMLFDWRKLPIDLLTAAVAASRT